MRKLFDELIYVIGIIGVAALFLTALNAPAHAGFAEGKAAFEKGEYATAESEWRSDAEAGNAASQYALGTMYHGGHGVAQDYGKALKWYEKSAEQGHPAGQYGLGLLHHLIAAEFHHLKDYVEAVEMYRLAAEQGYKAAQINLAWILATHARLREPSAAVRYAGRAVAQEASATHSNTLAAAYAAAGQFRDAVREQRHAISLLRKEGEAVSYLRKDYRKRLTLYLSAKKLTCPGGPCN